MKLAKAFLKELEVQLKRTDLSADERRRLPGCVAAALLAGGNRELGVYLWQIISPPSGCEPTIFKLNELGELGR